MTAIEEHINALIKFNSTLQQNMAKLEMRLNNQEASIQHLSRLMNPKQVEPVNELRGELSDIIDYFHGRLNDAIHDWSKA